MTNLSLKILNTIFLFSIGISSVSAQQLVEYPIFRENIGIVANEVATLTFDETELKTFAGKWMKQLTKSAASEEPAIEEVSIKFFANKGWFLYSTGTVGDQTVAYRTLLQRRNGNLYLTETETMEVCICTTDCENGGFAERNGCFCETGDCEHQMMISLQ